MALDSLADLLEELEAQGELRRVRAEVDPQQEIAAITERVASQHGPALFFERVAGFTTPVVTNLLGSEARILRALRAPDVATLADRLARAGLGNESETWLDRFRLQPRPANSTRGAAKIVKHGPCQQVVELGTDVNLSRWPALRSFAREALPTLSAAHVWTRDPQSQVRHVGNHPLQVVDRNRLRVILHEHDAARRDLAGAVEPLPVVISLGGDPVLGLAAGGGWLDDIEACELAGVLRGQPLELVACRALPCEVNAHADLVIEGIVDPRETPLPATWAGPNGYLLNSASSWTIQVRAVTHRVNPVLRAVIEGGRAGESQVVARLIGRLTLPWVQRGIPELVDYSLAPEAGDRNFAIVSFAKRYPRQARKVASAWWGMERFMFTKILVLVDERIDVHDALQVAREVGANVHPGRDLFTWQGPAAPQDHATPRGEASSHLGIDATRKLPDEHPSPWPEPLEQDREVLARVQARWSEYGLG